MRLFAAAVVSLSLLLVPASQGQTGSRNAAQGSQTLQGTQYREPNGRYTITIPSGWHVDTSQGNLKITNGTSWANFNTTSLAGGPLAVAQHEASQMQPMVGNWKVINQGNYTAGGHSAAGMTVTCDVPTRNGNEARVMLFTAMAAGNDNYVTMNSSVDAPTGEKANGELAAIFGTIRFAGE